MPEPAVQMAVGVLAALKEHKVGIGRQTLQDLGQVSDQFVNPASLRAPRLDSPELGPCSAVPTVEREGDFGGGRGAVWKGLERFWRGVGRGRKGA